MRSLFRFVSIAVLLGSAAVAQTNIDPKLASLKSQAAKLAAARKYPQAMEKLVQARAALRADRRAATGAVPKPKLNPTYQAEMKKLSARTKARWKKGPQSGALRQALAKEFMAAKQALARKHPPISPAAGSARAAGGLKVGARYRLVDAGLVDLMAGYAEQGGEAAKAAPLREQALVQKLEAYRTLGQSTQADQIAGRLLARNPSRPDSYRQAAEFYQERRRFPEAAAVWGRAIAHLEAGRIGGDAASRKQVLPFFYRQLAYAHSKSGKPAESRQALQRAQQLERGD